MRTALALSPHLDDAAFSCGGLLATLARDWRVVVATVFTATVPDPKGFALACQLDKGVGPEVDYMALRRAEDAAAMRALGAEPRHLPFREAPHRGYESAPALFADVRSDDEIAGLLSHALATLIADMNPDLILAPQAIGGHVDHVQVVRALRSLAPDHDGFRSDRSKTMGRDRFQELGHDVVRKPLRTFRQHALGRPLLWWRDFPYTVRDAAPKAPLAAIFAEMREITVPLDETAQRAKGAGCAAYASQLGFQFGGEAGLATRLAAENGVERLAVEGGLPEGILP